MNNNQQPMQQPAHPVKNKSNNKKKKVIVGCSIGGAVIAILVVVLLMVFARSGKTVTCTMNTTQMGIGIESETNIRVGDGEIFGGDMTVRLDLKKLQGIYKNHEKDIIEKMTERYKSYCKDHCSFDYEYAEGDSVKYTIRYEKDGVGAVVRAPGLENLSAQEIADMVQKSLENSNTTCKQN